MTEIVAFIGAVRHVTNIAKAFVDVRDEAKRSSLQVELNGAILDLQSKISVIQSSYQSLLDANEALKKQLVEYERWDQNSARYSLQPVVPGIFAYRLKSGDSSGEPDHWLCAACYNKREKSILQRSSKGSDIFVCPRDQNHMLVTDERM
jgi:hypothetical protein